MSELVAIYNPEGECRLICPWRSRHSFKLRPPGWDFIVVPFPVQHALEKHLARVKDQQDIESGARTREQVGADNSIFTGLVLGPIDFSKVPLLK